MAGSDGLLYGPDFLNKFIDLAATAWPPSGYCSSTEAGFLSHRSTHLRLLTLLCVLSTTHSNSNLLQRWHRRLG